MDNQIQFWNHVGTYLTSQCTPPGRFFVDEAGQNSRILEIGCGKGRILSALSAYGHQGEQVGIDWSKASLLAARRGMRNALLCLGDCRSLPFRDESFDGCVLSALLTCFIKEQDILGILKESHRVLKVSGILFVSEFLVSLTMRNCIRYGLGFLRYRCIGGFWAGYPFRHFRLRYLHKLLQSVGFQIVRTVVTDTKSWHQRKQKGICIYCRKNSKTISRKHQRLL